MVIRSGHERIRARMMMANQYVAPNILKELLPVSKFDPSLYKNNESEDSSKIECLICMIKFEEGDELRRL